MTLLDGLSRLLARSVRRGDVGHREADATPSKRRDKPPLRSPVRTVGVRRKALAMPHIACGSPPTRRLAQAIHKGH